jgi:hypothetical protein
VSVFIVGGDYLGNIPAKLKGFGFTEIMHLSGRKKGHVAVEIPSQVINSSQTIGSQDGSNAVLLCTW